MQIGLSLLPEKLWAVYLSISYFYSTNSANTEGISQNPKQFEKFG
jgi:hypothetical protein